MMYFEHDSSAGNDDKIMALRLLHGGAAVDAYWCLLEEIYRCETDFGTGRNQPGFVSLAHRLCVDADTLSGWIDAMVEIGLLCASDDGEAVSSERAAANIANYRKRQETARENGKKGGRKPERKPTRTKAASKSEPKPSPTPARPETKEKEKLLGTHEGYPNNCASGVAAAAVAAPPAAVPKCPLCGTALRINAKTGLFRCPSCRDEYEHGKVAWA